MLKLRAGSAGPPDDRLEVPGVPAELDDLGPPHQGDQRVSFHAGDHLAHRGPEILAGRSTVEVAHVPAQLLLALHQVGREGLVGEAQCRRHPGGAATDDHRPLDDRHRLEMQGHLPPDLGHRHANEVLGLGQGSERVIPVHPRTLVADVGHFKQELVQAGLTQGFAE